MDNREPCRISGTLAFPLPKSDAEQPRVHVPDAVCTSAQTPTVPRVRIVRRRPESGENPMLFILAVAIVSIAVGIIPRMRVPGGVKSANLGWMSEQWLAEHRASHSL